MEKVFFSEIVDYFESLAAAGEAVSLPEKVGREFFGKVAPTVRHSSAPAAAVPGKPPEEPEKLLSEIADEISKCRACPLSETRRNVVPGEGNCHAELMFIGEGPGADEDASGRPFVGEAGQLLTKMISAMGYSREEVYIANIVKCRPPGNRNPGDGEAACCIGYLTRQIAAVRPRAIVLLGSVPLRYLMKIDGITRNRGRWLKYHEIPVMPTFHPAYLLRDPSRKRPVWEDLKQVMKLLGKTLPDGRKG